MDLIQPAEISGKIMTLIDKAKKELIIVSPYNKIYNWKKLTKRIEKALDRGVDIKWYVRKNIDGNIEQITKLGITPIEIDNLHCKIYLNEQHAIVTSMNLHEYSDSSSIDIGYLITEKERYDEILEFIDTHIDSFKMDNFKTEVSEIGHVHFISLIIDFFDKYNSKSKWEKISTKPNRYGTVITVENFLKNYELILEPRIDYYRIDLRINHSSRKMKIKTYNDLEIKREILINECGEKIDFGNQMIRLKIDLALFKNYDYVNWNSSEFEILKPKLERIVEMYIKELYY